jgi:hypothetical protein
MAFYGGAVSYLTLCVVTASGGCLPFGERGHLLGVLVRELGKPLDGKSLS